MIRIQVIIKVMDSHQSFRKVVELPVLILGMQLNISVGGKIYHASIPSGTSWDPFSCIWQEGYDYLMIGDSFSALYVNDSALYNGITTQDFLNDSSWEEEEIV